MEHGKSRYEKKRGYAALYNERKRLGICVRCGRADAEKGRTKCAACLAKERGKVKALYNERKRQGICVDCGREDAEKGRTKCAACLAKRRQNARKKGRGLHE